MTPSLRQKEVLREIFKTRDSLLEGAVRSGKNWTADTAFLTLARQVPATEILIAGSSVGTVARNVIAEWQKMIDPQQRGLFKMKKQGRDEFLHIDWRWLRKHKFYIRGHQKQGDEKLIQGSSFGLMYIDEATNATPEFWNMASTRMSYPYSRRISTCNPGHPRHYLKTDYIDNEVLKAQKYGNLWAFKSFKFEIDDNPSLDEFYKQDLISKNKGVFYKRYILGLWCLAEGVIYQNFSDERNTTSASPDLYQHRVGIDFGKQNATVFLLGGKDSAGRIVITAEYYYSGRETGVQKTVPQYVDDLERFYRENRLEKHRAPIVPDPNTPSLAFIDEARARGFEIITPDTNVKKRIEICDGLFGDGNLIINTACKHTLDERAGYSWDDKAALRGKDEPLKVNDHCMDAMGYLVMSYEQPESFGFFTGGERKRIF